jgi:serine/threonine protein kinase
MLLFLHFILNLLHMKQANNFMSQIIEAVAYCHRRGILHRNLKPKHILVIPGNGRDLLGG